MQEIVRSDSTTEQETRHNHFLCWRRVLFTVLLAGTAGGFLLIQYNSRIMQFSALAFLGTIIAIGLVAYLVVDAIFRVLQSSHAGTRQGSLWSGLTGSFVMVGGVIMPFIALAGVLLINALQYGLNPLFRYIQSDPYSAALYSSVLLAVPLGNFLVLHGLVHGTNKQPLRLGTLNGLSTAASFVFLLLFLPLYWTLGQAFGDIARSALSIIAATTQGGVEAPYVVYGLLSFLFAISVIFSPLTCFIGGLLLSAAIWHQKDKSFARKTALITSLSALATIALMFGPDLSRLVTQTGLEKALSSKQEESRAGIRFLRAFGNKDDMLAACYATNGVRFGLFELFRQSWSLPYRHQYTVSSQQAREVFYRVFGRPFNSFAHQTYDSESWWGMSLQERGGTEVGGRVPVELAGSNIEGHIDANAALGYLEWTMTFKSDADTQEEARTHIALPPGAVISRLTLWVNGSPREAVFNERGLVRQAYQSVVQARRDPVLVESAGPDRVMVQCFPVPPKSNGGEIKIRLGISMPLLLEDRKQADLILPRLTENNFDVKAPHNISVSANGAIVSQLPGLKVTAEGAKYRISGTLDDQSLCKPGSVLQFTRNNTALVSWCRHIQQTNTGIIGQRLLSVPERAPKQLYVVIDGSAAMASQLPEVIAALSAIPSSIPTKVLFASDEISSLSHESTAAGTDLAKALPELRRAPCLGGPDNIPYLVQALQSAQNSRSSAVLWIHGPQPVQPGDPYAVCQSFRNNSRGVSFWEIEATSGPQKLLELLSNPQFGFLSGLQQLNQPLHEAIHSVARRGNLSDDLRRLFGKWAGDKTSIVMVRDYLDTNSIDLSDQSKAILVATAQLVPLWARDRSEELLADGQGGLAARLASEERIVTPLTSGVVLENDEQYRSGGLDPAKADPNYQRKQQHKRLNTATDPSGNYTGDDQVSSGDEGGGDFPAFGESAPRSAATRGARLESSMPIQEEFAQSFQASTNGTVEARKDVPAPGQSSNEEYEMSASADSAPLSMPLPATALPLTSTQASGTLSMEQKAYNHEDYPRESADIKSSQSTIDETWRNGINAFLQTFALICAAVGVCLLAVSYNSVRHDTRRVFAGAMLVVAAVITHWAAPILSDSMVIFF